MIFEIIKVKIMRFLELKRGYSTSKLNSRRRKSVRERDKDNADQVKVNDEIEGLRISNLMIFENRNH